MSDDSVLGSAFSQLGDIVKKTGQQVVKIPKDAAEDVEKQIVGEVKDKDVNNQDQQAVNQGDSNRGTEEIVKSFYEKSPQLLASPNSAGQTEDQKATGDEFRKQIKDKSPEEQKKLLELRNQLHKENYYDPTFNRPQKQEERPAEKIEKEKKMEAVVLEEKNKEKPPPLAVVRERNKAEMFRGAAG